MKDKYLNSSLVFNQAEEIWSPSSTLRIVSISGILKWQNFFDRCQLMKRLGKTHKTELTENGYYALRERSSQF